MNLPNEVKEILKKEIVDCLSTFPEVRRVVISIRPYHMRNSSRRSATMR